LSQGSSILQYLNNTLCKSALQQSDDALKVHFADSLAAYWSADFLAKSFYPPIVYAHVFGKSEQDARDAAYKVFLDEKVPAALEHAERRFKDVTSPFLLGDRPSIYDVQIGTFICLMYQESTDDKLAPLKEGFRNLLTSGKYPKFDAWAQAYMGELKEHLATRP
jgi:glutathione S-transferase